MSISEKTKKWLRAHCNISLKGKTVLVTGANSGVGFKTAETAVYLGADVILACRNPEKAATARTELLKDYPGVSVTVMLLDLSSLQSVSEFVTALREQKTDIHVFVNNAGAFHHSGEKTTDGFDLVLGTNYIGVYFLSEQILPYLTTLSHEVVYINTVSVIIKIAKPIDCHDFFCARNPCNFSVYARSKLCLTKYACALAKRYEGTNIRILMNHPGVTLTPLGLNAYGKLAPFAKWIRPLINSPEKSSLSVAYILSHEVKPGSIVGPHILLDCFGYPRVNRTPLKITEGAEELIRFTDEEIKKAKGRSANQSA